MPDGRGATGAGTYPALAQDTRLQVAAYPIAIVLHGRKAMPASRARCRTSRSPTWSVMCGPHFGNAYPDQPAAADVKAERN